MEQIGFRMQLNEGQAQEYRRRHDEIWPELVSLLKSSGVSDYSIFLHEPSNSLFAVLRRTPEHTMDTLPLEPIMQKWCYLKFNDNVHLIVVSTVGHNVSACLVFRHQGLLRCIQGDFVGGESTWLPQHWFRS